MYTDLELELAASGTDATTASPFYTSSVDLAQNPDFPVSPDMGVGREIMAVINIEDYDDTGGNTAVTFDVVVSSTADLQTATKVVGSSGQLSAADLELIDDAGRIAGAPLVVRINPDHFSGIDIGSADERYIGLRLFYATPTPGTLDIQASFVECFQTRPTSYPAKGSLVL